MVIGSARPSLRMQKGFVPYSVGQKQSGQLLSSAASESSTGNVLHLHRKLDNTQFNYTGRSYGVGTPFGLRVQGTNSNTQVAGYIYQEEGYLTNMTCVYNTTTDFALTGPVNEWIFATWGSLPNGVDGSEYSNYISHDGKAIVAIGVAFSKRSLRHYPVITAGEADNFLSSTLCEFHITPTVFNVTIDIGGLNITVKLWLRCGTSIRSVTLLRM